MRFLGVCHVEHTLETKKEEQRRNKTKYGMRNHARQWVSKLVRRLIRTKRGSKGQVWKNRSGIQDWTCGANFQCFRKRLGWSEEEKICGGGAGNVSWGCCWHCFEAVRAYWPGEDSEMGNLEFWNGDGRLLVPLQYWRWLRKMLARDQCWEDLMDTSWLFKTLPEIQDSEMVVKGPRTFFLNAVLFSSFWLIYIFFPFSSPFLLPPLPTPLPSPILYTPMEAMGQTICSPDNQSKNDGIFPGINIWAEQSLRRRPHRPPTHINWNNPKGCF